MLFQAWVFFAFLIFVPIIEISFAESNQSNTEPTVSKDIIRSSANAKIHYLLTEWQNSVNPAEFAKEHDLPYIDGKIPVYIYLNDPESSLKLPSEIETIEFDGNKVTAFVNSEELYQLEKLELIEKITPPDRVQKLSESKVPKSHAQKNGQDSNLWILGLIAIIITAIVILKKAKKQKN
jgi:hypothetical protein